MKSSDNDRVLYVALAAWLTERMARVILDVPPERRRLRKDAARTKGCIVGHGSMSAFEVGCLILEQLGVVVRLDGEYRPLADPRQGSAYCRILFDVPEVAERLRASLPEMAPPLDEVLLAFLQIATEFDGLPTSCRSFVLAEGFEALGEPLQRSGYLEAAEQGVKWTGKVSSQMRALYAWNEEGFSKDDRLECDIDKM